MRIASPTTRKPDKVDTSVYQNLSTPFANGDLDKIALSDFTAIVVIFHARRTDDWKYTACPDGIAAAWAANRYFQPKLAMLRSQDSKAPVLLFMGCDYEKTDPYPHPFFAETELVIVVDFSFPASVYQRWKEDDVTVFTFDHHPPRLGLLNPEGNGLADHVLGRIERAESGATLTWKALFPNEPLPAFLEYVRDRDLWQKKLPCCDEIFEAMTQLRIDCSKRFAENHNGHHPFQAYSTYGYADFNPGLMFLLYDYIAWHGHAELFYLMAPHGERLLADKIARCREITKKHSRSLALVFKHLGEKMTIGAMITHLPDHESKRMVSDLLGMQLTDDGDVMVAIAISEDQSSWEIRSREGDGGLAQLVAIILGGGGHPNTAGARDVQLFKTSDGQMYALSPRAEVGPNMPAAKYVDAVVLEETIDEALEKEIHQVQQGINPNIFALELFLHDMSSGLKEISCGYEEKE